MPPTVADFLHDAHTALERTYVDSSNLTTAVRQAMLGALRMAPPSLELSAAANEAVFHAGRLADEVDGSRQIASRVAEAKGATRSALREVERLAKGAHD